MKAPLITIIVEGGIVQDVTGVPDGYDYAVHDLDAHEVGDDCGLEGCQERGGR